jgi:hypothetical protein
MLREHIHPSTSRKRTLDLYTPITVLIRPASSLYPAMGVADSAFGCMLDERYIWSSADLVSEGFKNRMHRFRPLRLVRVWSSVGSELPLPESAVPSGLESKAIVVHRGGMLFPGVRSANGCGHAGRAEPDQQGRGPLSVPLADVTWARPYLISTSSVPLILAAGVFVVLEWSRSFRRRDTRRYPQGPEELPTAGLM